MEWEGLSLMAVNTKRLVIAATIVAVGCLLAVVPLPAVVFLSLVVFWGGAAVGMRFAMRWWSQRRFMEIAKHVSDIGRPDYFRRVPESQLESWVFTVLASRGFVLLGDPILGRSRNQGYAWREGKKAVVVIQQEQPLTADDLRRFYSLRNKLRAQTAFVVSPFSSSPSSDYPGLEILAGKDLLRFMSVLDGVPPMNIGEIPPQVCSCGSPQIEHVSRAGAPLLVCARYPDCQKTERPTAAKVLWERGRVTRSEEQRPGDDYPEDQLRWS